MSEPRWIRFELVGSLTRTQVWDVVAIQSGSVVGQVRWYAPWRRYVFVPAVGVAAVFDVACLLDLKEFIDARMRRYKLARAGGAREHPPAPEPTEQQLRDMARGEGGETRGDR